MQGPGSATLVDFTIYIYIYVYVYTRMSYVHMYTYIDMYIYIYMHMYIYHTSFIASNDDAIRFWVFSNKAILFGTVFPQ